MTPAHSESIVVVGASLAGLSAVRALRDEGFTETITVIGDEDHMPYDRPPLSKQVLTGETPFAETDLGGADVLNVTWELGTAAVGLNVEGKSVELADGRHIPYSKLVIATGTHVRRLPGFDAPGVHVLRNLNDAQALREDLEAPPRHVVVVGAGFIGAEIASSCISQGLKVSLVELEDVPFRRILGEAVGSALASHYERQGVTPHCGVRVEEVLSSNDRVHGLKLSDGSVIETDLVIVAIGVAPSTGWLESSGLPIDNGVICDSTLAVTEDIVAAGDVARWPNARLGEFRRVEHWENAIKMAEHAVRTLLGNPEPYEAVPWVWSDQFGAKFQMVGSTVTHEDVTVEDDMAESGRLLALYRRDDQLVAACGIRRNRDVLRLRSLVGTPGSWEMALQQVGKQTSPTA